jgi:anti-sigma factor RsiW
MSLCQSIATVAMAYLDDELAAEERHELEAHITECAACRAHLDAVRADHGLIARALAAPPAPDLLRARIAHSLDAEDKVAVPADRKRWSQYLLPGSAIAAAAAAIAVFVGVKPTDTREVSTVAREAVRLASRPMPYDVRGPQTNNLLQKEIGIEGPSCPNAEVIGARQTAVNGHDGVLVSYNVGGRFAMTALAMKNVSPEELDGNVEYRAHGKLLHLVQTDQGLTGVTYVDEHRNGYMFFAPALSSDDLLSLVASCFGP